VFGVGTLYSVISGIINATQAMKFLPQINHITLAWVAVYGGYQMLKARELGRKMLVVWISSQLSIPIYMVLTIFYSLIYPKSNVSFSFSNQSLAITYFAFCISLLVILAIVKLDKNTNDLAQTKIIGKLLSVLSPGLGRALVGNFWIGIGLYTLYLTLITSVTQKSTLNGVAITNPLIDFVPDLILWGIFALLDWNIVKNYGNSERENLISDSKADSA
jgi:hypothetical protein